MLLGLLPGSSSSEISMLFSSFWLGSFAFDSNAEALISFCGCDGGGGGGGGGGGFDRVSKV